MRRRVQIDLNPRGLYQGLRIADMHIRADAKATAEAVLAKLEERGYSSAGARSPMLANQIAAMAARPDGKEFLVAPGVVDPRPAMLELDAAIPKDWTVVSGGAHFAGIRGDAHVRPPRGERAHHQRIRRDRLGVSDRDRHGRRAGDGKLLLVEGDGSLMMHIQELETIRRHGIRMLICTVNDGGYGAEVHKFRAQGYDPAESQHGRGDIAAIARGFGLRGEKITSLERFKALFAAHEKAGQAGAVGPARRRQDPVRAVPAHPLRRSLSLRCGCRRRGNPQSVRTAGCEPRSPIPGDGCAQ